MFGLLKKKIGDFIGGLVKKEEAKPPETTVTPPAAEAPDKLEPEPIPVVIDETPVTKKEESVDEKIIREARAELEREQKQAEAHKPETKTPQTEKTKSHEPETKHKEPESHVPKPEKPQAVKQEKRYFEIREETPKELKAKLGIFSQIKGIFTNKIVIKEDEVAPLLEELQMSLLESDTSFDTAEHIVSELRKQLVGKATEKNTLDRNIREAVRQTLAEILSKNEPVNLEEKIREKNAAGEPYTIMFLGPNGAGKTTTIAKVAHLLKKGGITSVISASDTFRAAAIEQSVHHAEKLGIRAIRHQYGSDPAAVAFDAIAHAKANKLNAVLIDTAGRQETNYNLVKEMEKINRVIKPDLRVFIGEAIAGHAIIEQAKKFKEAVGIDAIILTKLDCDAKGGTSFSLAHETRIPIIYIGTGQNYDDLREFDADWIVNNVIAG